MIIAEQKRKTRIVEYLLYMWQVEDLIRACELRMELIEERVIAQYDQPEEVKQQIRQWYEELIEMMRREGVTEKGHLQINQNVLMALTERHQELLASPQETTYGALYYRTLPAIVQLRAKAGGEEKGEIETCFTAMYGYLLLKMQGRTIQKETLEAIKQINDLLTLLSEKYHEEKDV